MDEQQKIEIGLQLIEVLKLRRDPNAKDRYLTDWGNKTPLGIYETVKRIMEGGML